MVKRDLPQPKTSTVDLRRARPAAKRALVGRRVVVRLHNHTEVGTVEPIGTRKIVSSEFLTASLGGGKWARLDDVVTVLAR